MWKTWCIAGGTRERYRPPRAHTAKVAGIVATNVARAAAGTETRGTSDCQAPGRRALVSGSSAVRAVATTKNAATVIVGRTRDAPTRVPTADRVVDHVIGPMIYRLVFEAAKADSAVPRQLVRDCMAVAAARAAPPRGLAG